MPGVKRSRAQIKQDEAVLSLETAVKALDRVSTRLEVLEVSQEAAKREKAHLEAEVSYLQQSPYLPKEHDGKAES